MPLLFIALAGAAAVVSYDTNLFVAAVVNAGLSLIANGVLWSYGRRLGTSAPDWAAVLSMITAVAAGGLLVYGLLDL